MQGQPPLTRRISPENPGASTDNLVQRNSDDTSSRGSTSSWSEEPVTTVNMDIMTGHLILVSLININQLKILSLVLYGRSFT